MRIPLEATNTGTFTLGLGLTPTAQVELSPNMYGVTWYVERIIIIADRPATNIPPQFFLYKNFPSEGNKRDSTYAGDNATSELATPLIIVNSEKLVGVWNNGLLAGTARMTVYGTVETGRN